MDTEMSLMIQLQNAYGANAKVIAAVQSMWTQLIARCSDDGAPSFRARGTLPPSGLSGPAGMYRDSGRTPAWPWSAAAQASRSGCVPLSCGRHEHRRRHACRLWQDGQPDQRQRSRSSRSSISSPTQTSTGLVSNTYAGLGAGAAVSLDLNPQIAALQTWQNNINQATGTMQVTQTAMTQIQQIAVQLPGADRQPGRRRRVGSGQRRRLGATGAGAGRRSARYAGRQYVRIRRPGHDKSAGARSRLYTEQSGSIRRSRRRSARSAPRAPRRPSPTRWRSPVPTRPGPRPSRPICRSRAATRQHRRRRRSRSARGRPPRSACWPAPIRAVTSTGVRTTTHRILHARPDAVRWRPSAR